MVVLPGEVKFELSKQYVSSNVIYYKGPPGGPDRDLKILQMHRSRLVPPVCDGRLRATVEMSHAIRGKN
jgi:hypothetical protein